jgi:hypothetical protein
MVLNVIFLQGLQLNIAKKMFSKIFFAVFTLLYIRLGFQTHIVCFVIQKSVIFKFRVITMKILFQVYRFLRVKRKTQHEIRLN